MSRKQRRKTFRGRVPFANANRLRLPLTPLPRLTRELPLFEDRRTFHPDPVRPAASFSRPRHRLKASSPPSPAHFVQFKSPRNVLICVRRKIRKEVLHAFNKTGRVGQKRPVRNAFSEIKCR